MCLLAYSQWQFWERDFRMDVF